MKYLKFLVPVTFIVLMMGLTLVPIATKTNVCSNKSRYSYVMGQYNEFKSRRSYTESEKSLMLLACNPDKTVRLYVI